MEGKRKSTHFFLKKRDPFLDATSLELIKLKGLHSCRIISFFFFWLLLCFGSIGYSIKRNIEFVEGNDEANVILNKCRIDQQIKEVPDEWIVSIVEKCETYSAISWICVLIVDASMRKTIQSMELN